MEDVKRHADDYVVDIGLALLTIAAVAVNVIALLGTAIPDARQGGPLFFLAWMWQVPAAALVWLRQRREGRTRRVAWACACLMALAGGFGAALFASIGG